jgi:hypothetical protein
LITVYLIKSEDFRETDNVVSNFLYNYFGPDVDNEGCKVIWEEGVKPDCKTHKRQASWNNNSFIKKC